MTLELDHAFVFVTPGAPEFERLGEIGLVEGFRRAHPGQGTRNVCTCFRNAYLELIWVCDEAEAQAPECAALRLWERSRWRETGACPFGIALRRTEPVETLPFATVRYAPSYLPPGVELSIATPAELDQPLVFVVPEGSGPPPGAQRQEHLDVLALGAGTTSPASPALTWLHDRGLVSLSRDARPHLHLRLSGRGVVRSVDLRPQVALSLSHESPGGLGGTRSDP